MGPTLMVFIPRAVSAADAAAIGGLLGRTVHLTKRHQSADRCWEFLPNTDKHGDPSGCLCTLSVVPFGMEAGGSHVDTDFIDQARTKLPFMPRMTLQLDNFCRNDEPGHRVLATVAADLAEHFGGLIDVDGADYVLPLVQAMAVGRATVDGEVGTKRFHALDYVIDEQRTGTTYCIDATMMRAWCQHPAFWLIV